MLRQLLVSLIVVLAAAAGYVYLVPGATETLARYGIVLPEALAAPQPQEAAAPGGGRRGIEGNQRGGGGGPRAPIIVTATVTEGTINDRLTAIGEGAAAQSVIVLAPAGGTLISLDVKPGDHVAAGTVIGRLDSEVEEIAVEGARLAYEDAAAALARMEGLATSSTASNVQVTTARLAASTAALELRNAELALARRAIVTPIGGIVGLFQVGIGNALTSQSVVTTIEDTSEILISFWVPERYASALAADMALSATAVALPGETIEGTISALDNRIDPASRTLKVQAHIPNPTGKLRPGMSFSVAISFPGEAFPSVDPLSIQWSGDGAYLWKYADGVVERLPVAIIQRNSDGILVEGDLVPGDQIVSQGIQQLTPGASVRLLDEVLGAEGRRAAEAGS